MSTRAQQHISSLHCQRANIRRTSTPCTLSCFGLRAPSRGGAGGSNTRLIASNGPVCACAQCEHSKTVSTTRTETDLLARVLRECARAAARRIPCLHDRERLSQIPIARLEQAIDRRVLFLLCSDTCMHTSRTSTPTRMVRAIALSRVPACNSVGRRYARSSECPRSAFSFALRDTLQC
jgi:hypothetical protein